MVLQARRLQSALHLGLLYRGSRHPVDRLFNMCEASTIQVLGVLNPKIRSDSFDPDHLVLMTQPDSVLPTVFCPGDCNITVQVNLFKRPSPHRMQYMSLSPISLVLADKPSLQSNESFANEEASFRDRDHESRQARLIEKLKRHTVVHHPQTQKERLLPIILAQMNCSAELADLITRNIYLLKARPKRSLSVGEKVVESATSLRDYVLNLIWDMSTEWVWPLLLRFFLVALMCHRIIAEVILRVLEWRPRLEGSALKDISATAQQIDIRLQQFCYWPIQYMTLRRRRKDWESITDKHPDYIRFYNSLWLVANDVIIGIALGSYIIDNANWVASEINSAVNDWTIEGLIRMIDWLEDWPAGLKLNNELAGFIGGLVRFMIVFWRGKSLFILSLPADLNLNV